jgi:hypothetical protein
MDRQIFPRSDIRRAVFAAHLDMKDLNPRWQVAIFGVPRTATPEAIARSSLGKVDSLAGLPAVLLPSDSYLIYFRPDLAGVMTPADRTRCAKWIHHSDKLDLSPYLQKTSQYPETVGTEIILGLDLTDAVSVDAAEIKLLKWNLLKGRTANIRAMAESLCSAQGLALGIRITDGVYGKLRIDFTEDISSLTDFAKPLILEVLERRGAMIDDFAAWTAEVKPHTIYLGGSLSLSGLRRILSLVDPPLPSVAEETPKTAQPKSPGEPDDKTMKTVKQFKSLAAILNEAKNPNLLKMKTSGQYAVWLDRYAKQINQLPVLDVDPDLLNFSAVIASSMRDLSVKYRGVGIAAGTQSSNSNYYYDNAGNYRGGLSDQQIAQRIGRANAAGNEVELRRAIEDGMAAMRRQLSERYRIEF